MIPPVRSGILEVNEPAKSLRQQDEEEERKQKEMEANRKNREEVRIGFYTYAFCESNVVVVLVGACT